MRLFRLAIKNGLAGGTYHGVAEEGIPFRDIAGLIGRRLNAPVIGMSRSDAARQFGFLSPFVPTDNPTSGKSTQERLRWEPEQTGLPADPDQVDYF